ncbi:MAG: TetR family transcriptional regulator [Mesorhizobium sp.]|uniref:TetR/AcrR family transcriptional regulator n=1 Tax=unclassified Mesorhizobium TaxID=325217 RepID=UPI000F75574B|nr:MULTISPECIES: TetR/AcrR family transcriptional regulator [unclassified Mesorhizobium]AZO59741.1 TetR/AcrR family transcriptional regulator [Mesorhizobium sp. M1A.F.Ca.IN.022.06.1.1]MCT2580312.1 TetR/AcrR family transcriptional regulator [Mesorhizobium sp. P13.3]MDF3169254.1 TetR/AcrR family transcriptional regulator [Mesorhizobium sp. P16.1]MDF3177128.1 TetR/AcrR family transcriptional regulator [Mesorhizobium sp. P17.1]MDF3186169.1 TetR/AcrR family transcriptional regulator [Mesorhizobium 
MPSDSSADAVVRRSGLIGNTKVTREDWMKLALETLISEGVEAVRVLALGQKLNVSRSSFYWYFKSRQDLLDQLLDCWRNNNTRFILEQAGRPAASITEAVLNVFECWLDGRLFNPRLDFAVRAWSRQSAKVHRIVNEEDDARVDAIRAMFLRHGYADTEAFVRARVLYFTQIGYYSLEIVEPVSNRLSLTPAYLLTHTGKQPRQGEVEAFAEKVRVRTGS